MESVEIRRLAGYLDTYEERFVALFGRKETRHWAHEYLRGLLMDMERKNCWQIAEARKIPPKEMKCLQHFLYGSTWKWKPVVDEMARMVDEHIGCDDGIVVVDESGVRRWGEKSVGIGRQYLGSVGKVDNGQVGVYLTYGSENGSGFLNARLYIQKDWFDDPDRLREAGVPESVIFRTKPELAAEMVERANLKGLRARWLTADEGYGKDTRFLDVVDAMGFWYVVEVPVDTEVWTKRPKLIMPKRTGAKGRPRKKPRLARKTDRSEPVADVAERLRKKDWQPILVATGTKGPRVYEFAFRRVVEKRAGLPARDAWLMVRRSLGQEPEIKYYLSNSPADEDRQRLAVVGSERWRVEGAIKEAKGQTGLDESEGRNWNHWHHHTTLSMLAHTFLTCARARRAETHSPPLGTPDEEGHGSGEEGEAA